MEIVDAQLHANRMSATPSSSTPDDLVDATVAAMDAVGVDAVVLDEWSGWAGAAPLPSVDLGGGVRRLVYPVSEAAVRRYPDRFAYYARIDPRDPELNELMANVRRTPGCLALRWFPTGGLGSIFHGSDDAEARALWHRYFAVAEEHELAVAVVAPGDAELVAYYARAHPGIRFVLDHCGVTSPVVGADPRTRFDGLTEVLRLAEASNVSIKWSHAPRMSIEPFPYTDVVEQLVRVVRAFGSERVMWAADYTQARHPAFDVRRFSWGQSLYYLQASGLVETPDLEWILGRSARRILRWEAAERPSGA